MILGHSKVEIPCQQNVTKYIMKALDARVFMLYMLNVKGGNKMAEQEVKTSLTNSAVMNK